MTTDGLPSAEALKGLSQAQQKQQVETLLSDFLDGLDAAGREPDDWEAHAFHYALACLNGGLAKAAFNEVQRMLIPAKDRRHGAPLQPVPATRAALRAQLDETRQRNV